MSATIDQVVDELRERFFNTRIGDIPWVRDIFPSDKKFLDDFYNVCKGEPDLTLALLQYAICQKTRRRGL